MTDESNSLSKVDIPIPLGRPPGYPKTGGREKGTPNKKTLWLQEQLEEVGFNFAEELKKAYETADVNKIALLQQLIPFLAPKFKEQTPAETPPDGAQPMASIPTADLLAIAKGNK